MRFPSGEFVGVAEEAVLDAGIEAGSDGLGLAEEGFDGGGAFDAFEVVVVFAGVARRRGHRGRRGGL